MAEDHGASGPRAKTTGPRATVTTQGLEQKSYRDRESPESECRRVRSWIMRNEMRGVRRRCRKNSRFCQS